MLRRGLGRFEKLLRRILTQQPERPRFLEGFLEFQSLEDHLGEDRGAHANLRGGAVRTDPLLVDLAVQPIHDEPGNLQTGCLAVIGVLEFSAKQPFQDLLGSPREGVLGAGRATGPASC